MIGPFSGENGRYACPHTGRERGSFYTWKIASVYGITFTRLKPLEVDIPKGSTYRGDRCFRFGKTTMVLESLIPGLEASFCGEHLPKHVKSISAEGIAHVKLIDASPIGINVRSTVATYANIHDELRQNL